MVNNYITYKMATRTVADTVKDILLTSMLAMLSQLVAEITAKAIIFM